MDNLIATSSYSVIVGMGATGLSIAKHLAARGEKFVVFDTRSNCLSGETFSKLYPHVPLFFAAIDDEIILGAKQICLSPGVSREEAVVETAIAHNIPVVGDVELFLREIDKQKPVIGITGSNGKSTVTTLVGLALEKAGYKVGVGGNIGTPALDLLEQGAEIFVLELSSFQLESVTSPNLDVACILNISPDHMDRYDSISDYVKAKQKIYFGATRVVYHLHDSLTRPPKANGVERRGFGLQSKIESEEIQYVFDKNTEALLSKGELLIDKQDIKIKGLHNVENALALYAICDAAGVARQYVTETLREFAGLPHRTQWVSQIDGVTYINDSKATNVGAAEAAILGLHSEFANILLIAGGDGKGADFSEFGKTIEKYVKAVFLIGHDAENIAACVEKNTQKFVVSSLESALSLAKSNAITDELVLLSPACASMDMFDNFQHRGKVFMDCVARFEDEFRKESGAQPK